MDDITKYKITFWIFFPFGVFCFLFSVYVIHDHWRVARQNNEVIVRVKEKSTYETTHFSRSGFHTRINYVVTIVGNYGDHFYDDRKNVSSYFYKRYNVGENVSIMVDSHDPQNYYFRDRDAIPDSPLWATAAGIVIIASFSYFYYDWVYLREKSRRKWEEYDRQFHDPKFSTLDDLQYL
jgi:hypothetical protein